MPEEIWVRVRVRFRFRFRFRFRVRVRVRIKVMTSRHAASAVLPSSSASLTPSRAPRGIDISPYK